jgi:alpha-beta hydrolase superfamily lysophospholipase
MKPPESAPKKLRRSWPRRLGIAAMILGLVAFLLFNVMTFAEAWGMTHYRPVDLRTTRAAELGAWGKIRFLFTGPTVRRMQNTKTPADHGLTYTTRQIRNARGQKLETWCIPSRGNGPLVLLFPGYGGSKDTLLGAAVEFNQLGCETWLVDFSGIGGSDGRTTTIGWREGGDVVAAAQAARAAQPNRPLVLYGTSMGAAAILRAAHLGTAQPDAIILECPFDRLVSTIGRRCDLVGVPRIPFAAGVAFWAGVQHGFNGFKHNPEAFARDVRCPTLLMQGGQDPYVSTDCARRIARALGQNGTLQVIPEAGHAYLPLRATVPWRKGVKGFLDQKVTGPRRISDTASGHPGQHAAENGSTKIAKSTKG